MKTRPTVEEYFMQLAFLVRTRGSCMRRQVGCVLVNKHNHIIATGYNGRPSGFVECIDEPCTGADAPSGQGLDTCEAIHAEQNALLQCHDVQEITTAYCTTSPCISCVKLLLNTSCKTIVFAEQYPHDQSKTMWLKASRTWKPSIYYYPDRSDQQLAAARRLT